MRKAIAFDNICRVDVTPFSGARWPLHRCNAEWAVVWKTGSGPLAIRPALLGAERQKRK